MKQKSIPFSGYQKLVIALLALLQFTVVLDFMVLAPLGDHLMKSFQISPSQFGWVVSGYAFSAGISGIAAAGFADKYDRKKMLLFFYTGFIGGTLFCAFAESYYMLLAARIITGLFGGVIGAISLAIVTDLFALNQRGRVMGVVQMGFAASQVLGIPVGLEIANKWGWHAAFLMIVALALIIGICILVRMHPVDAHLAEQSDRSPFRHLLKTLGNRQYQTGYAATALLSVGGFMLMPFSSAYLINNIRIDEHQLPLIFMITGCASIVIMPIVGRLSDRIDKFHLFSAGSFVAIVMILVYTNLPPVSLWTVIGVNMILFMGIMGRMVPAMALTTSLPEISDRGAFMSVNGSLQQMAGGIAAVAAGTIVTQPDPKGPLHHYTQLGITVAIVIIICAWFIFRVSQVVRSKNKAVTGNLVAQQPH